MHIDVFDRDRYFITQIEMKYVPRIGEEIMLDASRYNDKCHKVCKVLWLAGRSGMFRVEIWLDALVADLKPIRKADP